MLEKKIQRRPIIEKYLKKKNIEYDIYETQKQFDSWKFANEINFDNYCAVVSCGGDETNYEVFNGMMNRKD